MLKYHNFDKEGTEIELIYNGKTLGEIDNDMGRELIAKMKDTYFGLFDLVSMTDFDDIKKRLMKNKVKAMTVDIYGKLMVEYNDKGEPKIFTESLSIDGAVIKELDEFANYVFSGEATNREYFFKESVRIFNDKINSLSFISK